jgi:hypothetical protein
MKTITKAKKFTFKVNRPTGKYKSFSNTYVEIKLDGCVVGSFSESAINNSSVIAFHVIKEDILEDGNPNCIWKSRFIKNPNNKIKDTQKFLNENFHIIIEKFNLYKSPK